MIATPGFYFSKWVFGWGLIQKILQKVDFLTKKWGFIQEKPQKQDFSISWGSIQEWGCNQADTVYIFFNKVLLMLVTYILALNFRKQPLTYSKISYLSTTGSFLKNTSCRVTLKWSFYKSIYIVLVRHMSFQILL